MVSAHMYLAMMLLSVALTVNGCGRAEPVLESSSRCDEHAMIRTGRSAMVRSTLRFTAMSPGCDGLIGFRFASRVSREHTSPQYNRLHSGWASCAVGTCTEIKVFLS